MGIRTEDNAEENPLTTHPLQGLQILMPRELQHLRDIHTNRLYLANGFTNGCVAQLSEVRVEAHFDAIHIRAGLDLDGKTQFLG